METERQRDQSCRLTVPNDLSFVPVIRAFVGSVAASTGFTEADRERIELAVEEAATNVIEHAFAPGEVASFDVTCLRVPLGLEVRIHDMGMPFDPSLVPQYEPSGRLESLPEGGLGGLLMRKLMDEYQFRNLGRDGKEIRLVKHLDVPVDDLGPPPVEPAVTSEDRAEPITFEVRLLRPEEAIEVARCVYDSYGYSYAGDQAYHPGRIAALNESGDLVSVVAVAPDGEIIGHNALAIHNYLPAELAMAATKRRFRGAGVASRLCSFLIDHARSTGLCVLHAKQVTVHPYTQRFCSKQGFLDCGLLLAHSPKSMAWRGLDESAQRNTDVIGCLFLDSPEPAAIYPPSRHAGLIERLFGDLGVPTTQMADAHGGHDMEIDGTGAPDGQSIVHVSVNAIRAVADMRVPHYGADALQAVREEVHWLRKEDVRVVEMYLNLEDPDTPRIVPSLEELGFVFTGIMPGTADGHALIMQLLNGVQVEYDDLTVVSDTAQALLAYARANDRYAV